MRRRQFIQCGFALAAATLLPWDGRLAKAQQSLFSHGVASGDPLADRVIIWTRVNAEQPTNVRWQVFADAGLRQMIKEGEAWALPQHDFTVKVDVDGLLPGQHYYYRFLALGEVSATGRTKTLSLHAEEIRLGVVSCSNYAYGFFNVYGLLAERNDLDAILHLGDYIYEYAEGGYGSGADLGRVLDPLHECIRLDDYRRRYALYRSDPDAQAVHAAHPFITVWDDHELANDCWQNGAENHNPGEGLWAVRKQQAIQAYFEWLPIREPTAWPRRDAIYRQFRFSHLADVLMLDTRVIGRDRPLEIPEGALAYEYSGQFPYRTMMGGAQEQWLYHALAQSKKDGVRWRLLGQQVQMAQRVSSWNDSWDGYAPNRARLFRALQQGVDNTVVLSGDIHCSWAAELAMNPFDARIYQPETGLGALAVELITPSVTSPSSYARLSTAEQQKAQADIYAEHPHIKFCDLVQHGYLEVRINANEVRSRWHYVKTVQERSLERIVGPGWLVRAGTSHLQPA
jgi:alkaline phosphatase D